MNNESILRALNTLAPGAQFSVDGDTLDGITWLDGVLTQPLDADVEDQVLIEEDGMADTAYLAARRSQEIANGMNPQTMVDALWAKDLDSDATAANALHAKRETAREDNPNPVEA